MKEGLAGHFSIFVWFVVTYFLILKLFIVQPSFENEQSSRAVIVKGWQQVYVRGANGEARFS